jgi:hypothetical protein
MMRFRFIFSCLAARGCFENSAFAIGYHSDGLFDGFAIRRLTLACEEQEVATITLSGDFGLFILQAWIPAIDLLAHFIENTPFHFNLSFVF